MEWASNMMLQNPVGALLSYLSNLALLSSLAKIDDLQKFRHYENWSGQQIAQSVGHKELTQQPTAVKHIFSLVNRIMWELSQNMTIAACGSTLHSVTPISKHLTPGFWLCNRRKNSVNCKQPTRNDFLWILLDTYTPWGNALPLTAGV